MCIFVFGGSTQIVRVSLLTAAFDPLNAFIITFVLCARHIFYGISMLEKFKNLGLKKLYMISVWLTRLFLSIIRLNRLRMLTEAGLCSL